MKLTEHHINELYTFTRQHYVYHYDLQTELVDHLANDIEQIWQNNPKLTFEKARDLSFKKFGIFGFMDVVEEKQKQMNKRYRNILWRFTKTWFTVPKVLTTMALFITFLLMFQIKYALFFVMAVLICVGLYDAILRSKTRKKHKKKEQNGEKIFLLEAMIGNTQDNFTGLTFINLFNLLNLTRFDVSHLNIYWHIGLSAVLTLLCILSYISNYIMPQKAQELLIDTYPEYKMVKNL